mmetsp:Transcript_1259/g.2785  ORF Transcript_1259/g.2785 Transcript_1259/m.2785 type:complete len:105 (+) Transcript_1259:52-366(+)
MLSINPPTFQQTVTHNGAMSTTQHVKLPFTKKLLAADRKKLTGSDVSRTSVQTHKCKRSKGRHVHGKERGPIRKDHSPTTHQSITQPPKHPPNRSKLASPSAPC